MYHILIVDEEEHLLWALERNLFPEREDIEVHTAKTGEQGLEILEEESIELLISDIKMPGDIDGFQLILRAKEMVPDARVMIITAFGTHRIQNFAERIGISHYIEKPFTVDELRSAVLEVLDEQEGFQGVLSDLELTDIIQMLCLAKRTALLHLKHRDRRGRIIFDAGDVVHAEFDGEVGAEAVYEMLSLRQGDIFMQSDFEPVERTIDMGWQDLLLEGVKKQDEARMEEQKERTRRELGGPEMGAQPGLGEPDVDEGEEDEPSRTKTPMGMGAPTMDSEESEPRDSGLGDESSGMFFSEEELEEINKASEVAIEEESEELGGGADESDARVESTSEEAEQIEDEPVFGAEESGPRGIDGGVEERTEESAPRETDGDPESGVEDPVGEPVGGRVESEPVEDPGVPEETGPRAGDEISDEQPAAAPRLGGEPSDSEPESGDWETPPAERSGAFAQAPSTGHHESDVIDNGVPSDAEGTLGADGEVEPPVDSMGPFASADQRGDSGPAAAPGSPEDVGESQRPPDHSADDGTQEPVDSSNTSPGMAPLDSGPAGGDPAAGRDGSVDSGGYDDPDPYGDTGPETVEEDGSRRDVEAEVQQPAGGPDDDTADAPAEGRATGRLETFVEECPGLKATALISTDDRRPVEVVDLDYGERFDDRGLAEGLDGLFSRAARSVEAFRDGDRLREVQLVLDGAYLLARAVDGTGMLHVAIVDKEISLGVALVLMREFGDELKS